MIKRGSNEVSILVFLEPLLRLDFGAAARMLLLVSILVFLEPLLRHHNEGHGRITISLFQSLFFWNHCLDC